jgi:hypothetical protein
MSVENGVGRWMKRRLHEREGRERNFTLKTTMHKNK